MNEPEPVPAKPAEPSPLKAALRQARIEAAEQTGVVIDLHDAEMARLEILNEALEPVFAGIPPDVDMFDRGISPGRQPRLWVDAVAHVEMGRDKRLYRFLHDTRFGRSVLMESTAVEPVVHAITQYVARRLIERERAIGNGSPPSAGEARMIAAAQRRRKWRGFGLFVLGALAGIGGLIGLAFILGPGY